MKIKTLSPETIQKIAAGEVILCPQSVVKELVENAVDAGARHIDVAVRGGGKTEILVRDDGCGIAYDEVGLAFKRHATSKISFLSDLDTLTTLGFRGEALASVAAVADVVMTTRADSEELGSRTVFKDGACTARSVVPYAGGTEIVVTNLFAGVPARCKYLKKDPDEERAVRESVKALALARPDIAVTYTVDGRQRLATPGTGELKAAARGVFGSYADTLHPFCEENAPMKVHGLIGDLDARRAHRGNQLFFINGRVVKSRKLTEIYESVWEGKLMHRQYPGGVIFIDLPPDMLDVNVHPQKSRVRVYNESLVAILLRQCLVDGLESVDLTGGADPVRAPEAVYPTCTPTARSGSGADVGAPKAVKQAENGMMKIPPAPVMQDDRESPVVPERASEVAEQQSFYTPRPEDRPDLTRLRRVGVLFNTYILLEDTDCFYTIDQHAAHEAVLYEAFSKAFSGAGFCAQRLALPAVLPATPEELDAAAQHSEKLKSLGFSVKIADSALTVSAVPVVFGTPQQAELIRPVLACLSEKAPDPAVGLSRVISAACKAAVKGGEALTDAEIAALLARLSALENPYTCPHGRPVMIRKKKYELEKLFKRIV